MENELGSSVEDFGNHLSKNLEVWNNWVVQRKSSVVACFWEVIGRQAGI